MPMLAREHRHPNVRPVGGYRVILHRSHDREHFLRAAREKGEEGKGVVCHDRRRLRWDFREKTIRWPLDADAELRRMILSTSSFAENVTDLDEGYPGRRVQTCKSESSALLNCINRTPLFLFVQYGCNTLSSFAHNLQNAFEKSAVNICENNRDNSETGEKLLFFFYI